jgi:hypothetical protein
LPIEATFLFLYCPCEYTSFATVFRHTYHNFIKASSFCNGDLINSEAGSENKAPYSKKWAASFTVSTLSHIFVSVLNRLQIA